MSDTSLMIRLSIKYLGINLSYDLRWNDHVNEITTKANKTLNFLDTISNKPNKILQWLKIVKKIRIRRIIYIPPEKCWLRPHKSQSSRQA